MSVDRILKGHDIFRSLTVDEAHHVVAFSSVKKFEADETVFECNDAAGHVYMLLKGSVHLQLPANPPSYGFVISEMAQGELFGLSPLLDSPRYTSTARCLTATELLSIEARPLREMLRRNYPIGFEIMNRVAYIYFNRYVDVLKNLQGVVSQISLIH